MVDTGRCGLGCRLGCGDAHLCDADHFRTVIVSSVKYAECGSAWYEMVYHGTQLAYLPVPDPR